MKKILYVLIFILWVAGNASAQTAEQVRNYYESKSWDSVINCGKAVIDLKRDEYDTYLTVGQAYNKKLMFAEAIPYLEKAKLLKDAPSWVNAWAMCELGSSYYVTGNKKLSSENLIACIKLNATKNSQKTASQNFLIFGFDSFYGNWHVEQSENFYFWFQNTSITHKKFITSHENAFDSLSTLFNCKLPHKMDFFVWSNDTDQLTKKMIGQLAFSKPVFGITHTSENKTLAHEIMHHILYYAFPGAKRNELITEGTCVCFDLSRRDNLENLKKEKNSSGINVRDCWNHPEKFDDAIIYPLGGELVKRIFEKFGKEKFFSFMTDQSLENAERIFGKELDSLISQLESDVNH